MVLATLSSCIGLIAPCNRAAHRGPRPVAREHWPTSSLCPGQRKDPVPMTPHGLPPAPSAAAASARGKTFTIEAERRLKECQERPEPFTEGVDAYRGKS